jgi:arylsulfatase A-like enzyme
LINVKRDDERKSVAFSEETMYGEELKSIRTGGHKLIAYPQFIKTELYDIEKDPKEKYDLSTVETEKVEELKTILLEIYKGNMELAKKLLEDSSVKIDKKTEEQLKSLGYIK